MGQTRKLQCSIPLFSGFTWREIINFLLVIYLEGRFAIVKFYSRKNQCRAIDLQLLLRGNATGLLGTIFAIQGSQ